MLSKAFFNQRLRKLNFRHLSIRKRLPLFICLLLLSVILVFGSISYLGVKQATLKVTRERLHSLSKQLSAMLSDNTQNLITATYITANKPAIIQYLSTDGKDSVAEFAKLVTVLHKDSSYKQAELVRVDGSTVFRIPSQIQLPEAQSILNLSFPSDSGYVGNLYHVNNEIYYPVVATIAKNKMILGYFVRWRKMASRGVGQVTKLMGTDARFFVGNADGSFWTDLSKAVDSPPLDNKDDLIEFNRSGTRTLASVGKISNGAWMVSVEFPRDEVLEAAHNFLYWLIIAGVLIIILGIMVAWIISRNLTRPLVNLTEAATLISNGNYSRSTEIDRRDELGKLARAFNAMIAQVERSQHQLKKKVASYKILFDGNPMPMWILSKTSLDILDVNDAAIREYGYSRNEFLKLNAVDLRPVEDIAKYLDHVNSLSLENKTAIWRHKRKDGTIMMVDVMADNINYEGEQARLVLANDVTDKLKLEAELLNHRIQQQEIITETTILAQEKEREDLGKELHDNINQILASTKLYLELARNGSEEVLSKAILKSYENVNLAIGEIRHLSKKLVPPMLDDMLINIIKEMTEEIQAVTKINISVNAEEFSENFLNDNIKLMIYRIVQEQVNNIIKHANASKVSITLSNDEVSVSLLITDNGVGFDTTQKSKGIGLRNIDNRVKFYNGSATISSQKGRGCTLEIYFPLRNKFMEMHAAD